MRQIAHAKAFAERHGWTVPDACIFVDDGISGAEFGNRPGFVRVMAALKPRPPFQVLIMSEESRLGREAIETAYALKQLITAGVGVVFYLEPRQDHELVLNGHSGWVGLCGALELAASAPEASPPASNPGPTLSRKPDEHLRWRAGRAAVRSLA